MLCWRPRGEIKRKRKSFARSSSGIWTITSIPLKMNPLKYAFGVSLGKFLRFIVRHWGIEIDQSKIEAILKMPEPRNIHELKSLQGKLAYIRRFIPNLVGRCQPFTHLMKKDMSFYWDDACTNAFNKIKKILVESVCPSSTGTGTPTYPPYCSSNTFGGGVVGATKWWRQGKCSLLP